MRQYIRLSISRPFFRAAAVGFCGLSVIGGLYWLTFRDIAAQALLSSLSNWNFGFLAILGGLNLLILQAMCLRWRLILKRFTTGISFSRLVGYRLGANAVSYITPGPQFGGEPLQVHWLVRCHGVPSDAAAASVVVDRLIELIANFCFIFVAGVVLLHHYYFDPFRQITMLAILCLPGIMAAVLCKAMLSGQMPLTRAVGYIVGVLGPRRASLKVLEFLERSEKEAAAILNAPRGALWLYCGCAGIQWLLMLGEFWFIYRVSGLSLELSQLFLLAVAARLAFLLPLPGALGVLEAGQSVVLASLNIDPVFGLAACLVMRFRDLLLIGGGAGLTIHRLLSNSCERAAERCRTE